MGKETQTLLEAQKKHFGEVEEKKVLLLGSSEKSSEFYNLKKNLNWHDTDEILNEELNKTLELNQRLKENIDSNILTQQYIFDYCLKNNYVLCNIKEYKGQIPNELLEAIAKYAKDNDLRLESDANIGQLFLLCRFSDIQGNNDNLNKSKRYKKGELPKIMLLEKLLNGNAYIENHYKIIFEMGVKKPIGNFINSLYKTSVKTLNFTNNILFFYLIIGLILIINTIVLVNTRSNTYEAWYPILKLGWLGINITLLIKIFLSAIFDYRDSGSFNSLERNYKEWPVNDKKYNTSYLVNYISAKYSYKLNVFKTKIKDYTYCLLVLITFSGISYGIIDIEQNYQISKVKKEQQLKTKK